METRNITIVMASIAIFIGLSIGLLGGESPPKHGLTVNGPATAYMGLPCILELLPSNQRTNAVLTSEEIAALPIEERKRVLQDTLRDAMAFPDFDLLSEHPPLTVEIKNADTGETIRKLTPPRAVFGTLDPRVVNPRLAHSKNVMRAASSNRSLFLADIGRWLGDLPDGDYTMDVSMHNILGQESCSATGVRLHLSSIQEQTKEDLTQSIQGLNRERLPLTPTDWIRLQPDYAKLRGRLSREVVSSLALYSLLASAVAEKSAAAPLALLDNLPEHLALTREALRYEAMLARGDDEAAAAVGERLLAESKVSRKQLEEIKTNGIMRRVIAEIGPPTEDDTGNTPK